MADGELATVEPQVPAEDAFLSMMDRALVNPEVDVEKLERLYVLNERREAEVARRAYQADMNALQAKLPVIEHTKKIGYEKNGEYVVKGTYTPWEDIDEQIRPLYIEHGFSLSFEVNNSKDGIFVSCIIMHHDGHREQYKPMWLPPDPSGKKNAAQAIGSSISYAKRYSACLALNITTRGAEGETDDDDGEAASQPMSAHKARQHKLWETLESEFMRDCDTQGDADQWLQRVKAHRTEYQAMPHGWKALFYHEVFLPRKEKLKVMA